MAASVDLWIKTNPKSSPQTNPHTPIYSVRIAVCSKTTHQTGSDFAHYSKLHSLLTRFSPVNPPGDVPKCQAPAKLVPNWAVQRVGCPAGRPGASSSGFWPKRSQNQQKPGFSPEFARRDNSI